MIEFKKGFYADVRTEDRSRTIISYTDGILQEMKTSVECRAFLRVYDGRMWYYASVTDLAHLQIRLTVFMRLPHPTRRSSMTLLSVALNAIGTRRSALPTAPCVTFPPGKNRRFCCHICHCSRRIPVSPHTKAYTLTATACFAFSPVSERMSRMIIRLVGCPSRVA